MQLIDAIKLIEGAKSGREIPEVWADLGCGNGLFTQALATILPRDSTVHAIDKVQQSIRWPDAKQSRITFTEADFEKTELVLPRLDGILMANSLHYVAEKEVLLKRLQEHLKPEGKFLIVEYNGMNANPWVPFPVDYQNLVKLFSMIGFDEIRKLGERNSRYGQTMYACLAREKALFL